MAYADMLMEKETLLKAISDVAKVSTKTTTFGRVTDLLS